MGKGPGMPKATRAIAADTGLSGEEMCPPEQAVPHPHAGLLSLAVRDRREDLGRGAVMWAGHSCPPSTPARAPMQLDQKAGGGHSARLSRVLCHLPFL